MTTSTTNAWPVQPAGRIALLEADPDLAGTRRAADLRSGAQLTVPAHRISAGRLPEPPVREPEAHLGFLLLRGLVLYEVAVCGRVTAEILGPGDVVRPWARVDGVLASESRWTALNQVLIADLGELDTSGTIGREVMEALVIRSGDRANASAIQRSIATHVRVDVRVLAYLWHLADRFGVVVPGAVRLDLPLTHAVLARLVGARRPTVTTALQRLMQLGYLRREKRTFVLIGDASAVEELESRSPAREFARSGPNGSRPATQAA